MIANLFSRQKFIFLCSAFSIVFSCFSQTYNFENFSVEDGLVQNQILSIFQDEHGYIWFGTNGGGISIYDGRSFRTISKTDGLVSNVVFSIMQDNTGNMIIGTKDGLSVYNGFKFKNYTMEDGLPHNWVFCTMQNANDEIWIGTEKGMVKLSEGKIIPFSEDKDSLLKNISVFKIYRDSKRNVWLATKSKGAIKYNESQNSFSSISVENGLDYPFVRTIVEDREGNIWFGTPKGLNKMNNKNQISQVRLKDNETTVTVTSSLLSKDGILWFGTLVGIDKYAPGETVRYNENNGLINNNIWSILEDREGNLWIGTLGKGVAKFRYKGELFRNYSTINNLPNDLIQTVFQDRKGDYWIGSPSGIARMKKDGAVETFTKTKAGIKLGQASNTYSIAQDLEGNLWFATLHNEEACHVLNPEKNSGNFISYSEKDGFSDNKVQFVMCDRQGGMWFGTSKGITRRINNKFSILEGTEKMTVWYILQDNRSHFWFGTESGAVKYDGSSFQYFTKKDGLTDGRVRTIVQDSHRIYWFATDEGLFSYDGKTFQQIDQTSGLSSNTAYSLLLDGKYSLWIGTNKGLNRLNIDRYYSNKEIDIKQYGKEDGFIGVECNGNAAFKDNKGHLWFGTVKGVTIFNPEMESVNTNEPLTHITNLRLEFENFNWTKYSDSVDKHGLPVNLVLPYNKNHLTFDFVGVSLTIPKKVKYEYKLEPLETSFTPPTSQNEAVYPHLPAGNYTFILKAKNNDDYWNSHPIEYNFTVLPPWYQTWWFRISAIAIIVILIFSYIKWREKKLTQEKKILEEKVTERTHELREEKEKVEQINLEVLEKNKIIEHKNKDITDSITYAQGIQQSTLPPDEKIKKYLPQSFILFRPRDIVSGDFYWMEHLPASEGTREAVLFAVCDCTGHGVPGGFVSMVGSNSLSRTVNEQGIAEPAKILDRAALFVEQSFSVGKRKDGMDVVLCSLEFAENVKLQFSAANNPLYIIRKKENGLLYENGVSLEADIETNTHYLFQITPDKQPVGAYEFRKPFTNHNFNLVSGDTIYLSSDGFRDQFGGPKGKKFMAKNFKQVLISLQNKNMNEQEKVLDNTISGWMGENEQNDDICIIGVRI